VVRTSKGISDASRRVGGLGIRVVILDSIRYFTTKDAPGSFVCRNLRKGSWRSEVGRRLHYVLNLLWYLWAEENLDHHCGSFRITWRSGSWLTVVSSIGLIP